MASLANIPEKPQWVVRHPLRPGRLGNPRRQPKGVSCQHVAQRNAGRAPARSLDNNNLLGLSLKKWLKATETKADQHKTKSIFQGRLLQSIEKIVRSEEIRLQEIVDGFSEGLEEEVQSAIWREKRRCEDLWAKEAVKMPTDMRIEIRGLASLLKGVAGMEQSERDAIKSRLKCLLHIESRSRDYTRLYNCQREWIVFRAKCCSTSHAVPIGCNHRLCFYCGSARSEKMRARATSMLDRLEHPAFLTLTIPNVGKISKRTYSRFRNAWNELRKNAGWVKGGAIALETTYNSARPDKPWHVHAHVLLDATTALPVCHCHPSGSGFHRKHKPGCLFVEFKKRLEFDWFVLTGGRALGWRSGDYSRWLCETRRAREGRSARHRWNSGNRRVIDIRRVDDRQGAVLELIKYITKASAFCNIPEAVDEFIPAVKGTRMLQTFGSWYGVKLDDGKSGDWEHLKCECGENDFERQGRVFREGVFQDETGRWQPKKGLFPDRGAPPGEVA